MSQGVTITTQRETDQERTHKQHVNKGPEEFYRIHKVSEHVQRQHAPSDRLCWVGRFHNMQQKLLTNLKRWPLATAAHVACSSLAQSISIVIVLTQRALLACSSRHHFLVCNAFVNPSAVCVCVGSLITVNFLSSCFA